MAPDTDTPVATPWQLFEGYRPLEGTYDEMVSAPGVLRPHCEPFVRSLEAIGPNEFISRSEGVRRSIRENGVTYNIYGDPQGVDRPWELDMVPLLISPAEWTRLEAGLRQRTTLLNLILADVYGPQALLTAGLLPPSLVLSTPAFLRPCHGISVPHGIHLHMHAVDLTRSPDGQWRVLADRTQAPSGAGYALENRIVLLRSLPETFRDCQVQRLASFFRAQRDTLMALAPHPHDQPRVVLLTPGPYNETYFEHAYLASYLGFTLVEGGDLTVRDRRVFIKTLEGLQPVDVILRRLDDGFCDPLENRRGVRRCLPLNHGFLRRRRGLRRTRPVCHACIAQGHSGAECHCRDRCVSRRVEPGTTDLRCAANLLGSCVCGQPGRERDSRTALLSVGTGAAAGS